MVEKFAADSKVLLTSFRHTNYFGIQSRKDNLVDYFLGKLSVQTVAQLGVAIEFVIIP